MDIDTISKHVSTHLANAGMLAQDDFDEFFASRARALLDKVSFAMGKPIDDLDIPGGHEPDTLEDVDDTDDI